MKILINPLGLVSHTSLRDAQDGFTYFGRKKNVKKPVQDQGQEENVEVTNPIFNVYIETSGE